MAATRLETDTQVGGGFVFVLITYDRSWWSNFYRKYYCYGHWHIVAIELIEIISKYLHYRALTFKHTGVQGNDITLYPLSYWDMQAFWKK